MDDAGAKLVLVTGGVRSGKSRFAENLARNWGEDRVVYVATCQAGDEEMEDRIRKHRQRRPPDWHTLEEPLFPARAVDELAPAGHAVLVDCMALLVSNHLVQGMEKNPDLDTVASETIRESVLEEVEALVQISASRPAGLVVVSNEVGWGLVPPYASGRLYRDLLGEANSRLAAAARSVYLLVAGLPLDVKSWAREEEEKYGQR